jgi:hypothetical protein
VTEPAARRGGRDSLDVEALLTDRYLDALLAAADRHALDAPSPAELDPQVRSAIRRLRRDLIRVHPSFRFEERLAARLAEAAATISSPGQANSTRPPTRIATGPLDLAWDPAVDPAIAERAAFADLVRRRPFLIGGAMASAAVSLAGAALVVARRRARPPAPVMARAARAVRTRRRGRASSRQSRSARRAPLA